jgi:hypothetical protein
MNNYINKILPNNYVNISESIIGLSSIIGNIIKNNDKKLTFDKLWQYFEIKQNEVKGLRYHKPNDVLLSLNLLFMMNIIEIQEDGLIFLKYDN